MSIWFLLWVVLACANGALSRLKQLNPPTHISAHLVDIQSGNGVYCAVNSVGQTLRSNNKGKTWAASYIQKFKPGQPIFGFTGTVFYLSTGDFRPYGLSNHNTTLWVSKDCDTWSNTSLLLDPHYAAQGKLNGKSVTIFATYSTYPFQSWAVIGEPDLTTFQLLPFNGTGSPLTPCTYAYNPVQQEWLLTPWSKDKGGNNQAGLLSEFVTTKDFKTYRAVSKGFNVSNGVVHRVVGITTSWVFMLSEYRSEDYVYAAYVYRAKNDGTYQWTQVHIFEDPAESTPPIIRGLIGPSLLDSGTTSEAESGSPDLIALDIIGGEFGSGCAADQQPTRSYIQTMAMSAGLLGGNYYPGGGVPEGCGTSNIWKSSNHGETWQKVATKIKIDGANYIDGRFVGVGLFGTVKTSKTGSSWDVVIKESGFKLSAFSIASIYDEQTQRNEALVLGVNGFGLLSEHSGYYYSNDKGQTWKELRNGVKRIPAGVEQQQTSVFLHQGDVYACSVPANPYFNSEPLYRSHSLVGPFEEVIPQNKHQLPLQGCGANGTVLVASQNIVQPPNHGPPSISNIVTLVSDDAFKTYQNYTHGYSCSQNGRFLYSKEADTWISYLNQAMVDYSPNAGYCVSHDGAKTWKLLGTGGDDFPFMVNYLATLDGNFVGVNWRPTHPQQTGTLVVSTDKGITFNVINNLPFDADNMIAVNGWFGEVGGNYVAAQHGELWISDGPNYKSWKMVGEFFDGYNPIGASQTSPTTGLLFDSAGQVYEFTF